MTLTGYKHQWDLVNERTGELTKLHHVDASKVNLVTALDIYEDDEAELLLCYNSKDREIAGRVEIRVYSCYCRW